MRQVIAIAPVRASEARIGARSTRPTRSHLDLAQNSKEAVE